MKGYRKVLIAVNRSKGVLKKGINLARDEKTWITIIKVIPPRDGDLNLTAIKNIEDVLNSGMEADIREIREIVKSERALVRTRVEEGEISEKIAEVARDERCDIIIMGNDKPNWFKRLIGANVVEKVIEAAPCPVLVV